MHHVEVGAIIHPSPSFFYPPVVVGFQLEFLLEEPKNGEEYSRDIGVVPADWSVATAAGRVFVGTAG